MIKKQTMRKIINFFLIMMTASSLLADFKIMGGINQSNYNYSPEEENIQWNYKLGFLAGIGLEKKFSNKVLLEFDILFFQKGSKAESGNIPGLKWKYSLNVFSFPILFRTKFLYDSSPYVLGGIEPSFIVSHKSISEGEEDDLKDNTHYFDYGLVFGCGYEIKLQEYLFLFIEARYHLGFRNIISNPYEEESMKTKAFLVIVGARS